MLRARHTVGVARHRAWCVAWRSARSVDRSVAHVACSFASSVSSKFKYGNYDYAIVNDLLL